MAIGRKWAGNAVGTHTGNLYLELEGDDDASLRGSLRFNDDRYGIVIYAVEASFDGEKLKVTGKPETTKENLEFGELETVVRLNAQGQLIGDWKTSIGSGGAFRFYPATIASTGTINDPLPDQLYTSRFDFGAIEIDRGQIIELADDLQR
ncbi:MAG: hypothetical protein VX640_04955 [Pseudomonadota bacterium]|nr:hypothetical protein [Pseudomonadota bacterium]